MDKIQTALIGVSGFGHTHYSDLIRATEAGVYQPVAATIINQDDEKEKCEKLKSLGCELFTDHKEMLRKHGERLDLTMIPTGIPLHAPMTIDALRAGSNVFVEKPAAAVLRDVRAMKAASEETGRFVAVGFQLIYANEAAAIKQAILAGRIGRLKRIHCVCRSPRPDSYYARNRWVARLKLDGEWVLDSPNNNAFAHFLNQILFYAGPTLKSSARLKTLQAELYRARAIESYDTGALHAVTEDGVPLRIYTTHAGAQNHPQLIRVEGEKGVIENNMGQSARIALNDGTEETLGRMEDPALREKIMARLAEKVRCPESFACSLDIAGAHTLAVNVSHESSAIHTIPETHRERVERNGSQFSVIPGLDEALYKAWQEGKLLSELDLPWTSEPGERIEVATSQTVKTGAPTTRS